MKLVNVIFSWKLNQNFLNKNHERASLQFYNRNIFFFQYFRGATEQILDEAERSLHDALCVLTSTVKETKTVYGGGCSEMLMANAVMDAAATTAGKEAIAMEAYAKALTELPTIIAENGGYDAAQLVSELRALHKQNKSTMGLSK